MSVAGFNAPSQSLLCSRFLASGQWDRALAAAHDWLAQEPENARAHLTAGRALIHLERHAEAEPHLRQVLAVEPENDVVLRFLSIVEFAQQRYREADESLQRAIALNPNDSYHWYHLAWMFYKQGDLASAGKYAARARELNPRDAGIINLQALCLPRNSGLARERLEHYREALELNPESPHVHNNIGVYYLNNGPDYRRAEDSFRRALFFNPRLQTARANLFLVLKRRDPIYRWLRAPKDFLMRGFAFMGQKRRQNLWLYLLLLPLWFLAVRYVVAGLALWCLLVWPLVKAYEMLTIGDIRQQAGEIGARRGGFLGYRRWPLPVRLGIFAATLMLFWSSLGLVVYRLTESVPDNLARTLFGLCVIVGGFGLLAYVLVRKLRKRQMKLQGRCRRRKFDHLLDPQTKPRSRWRSGSHPPLTHDQRTNV